MVELVVLENMRSFNKLLQQRNIIQRESRNKYMFTHRVYESFDEIQANTMILDYLSKNIYNS